jgi:hypothetical protein
MAVEITEFRLAFIWTQTLLSDNPAGKTGPYAGRGGYETLVGALQRSDPAQGFDLPWLRQKPFAHRFWVKYLSAINPGNVTTGNLWLHAVPLRATAAPVTLSLPPGLTGWAPAGAVTESRVTAESFLYPFGLGLIISVTVKGALTGGSWIDLACALSHQPIKGVHFDGEAFEQKLPVLARDSVAKLAARDFGPMADAPDIADPFTIMTVIQGAGVPAEAAPDETARRYVQAGATLDPRWSTAKLYDLVMGENLIDIKSTASPGDVVYAVERGRTIWSPSAFSAPPGPKNSLGCYYRNQVFASLQTEALCRLAKAMYQRIQNDRDQPAHLDDLAKIANAILPGMHQGTATYRSKSIQKLIDDNGMTDAMQSLVKRYGGPAWPPPAKP